MDGRRTSGNVDDRRGRGFSGKTLGIGGGIVGVIVMAAITLSVAYTHRTLPTPSRV